MLHNCEVLVFGKKTQVIVCTLSNSQNFLTFNDILIIQYLKKNAKKICNKDTFPFPFPFSNLSFSVIFYNFAQPTLILQHV